MKRYRVRFEVELGGWQDYEFYAESREGLDIQSIWTVSLQGVLHFLSQRLEADSQWEIQEYARAVRDLAQPLFPESFRAFAMNKESE